MNKLRPLRKVRWRSLFLAMMDVCDVKTSCPSQLSPNFLKLLPRRMSQCCLQSMLMQRPLPGQQNRAGDSKQDLDLTQHPTVQKRMFCRELRKLNPCVHFVFGVATAYHPSNTRMMQRKARRCWFATLFPYGS